MGKRREFIGLGLTLTVLFAVAWLPLRAEETSVNEAAEQLHRADFRVEGSSCVACLRRIARKLKGAPGVLKADVSIFRPYWGLVIYDAGKTNLRRIFEAAREERVTMSGVEDVPIAQMPAVVLPRQTATGSGVTPGTR